MGSTRRTLLLVALALIVGCAFAVTVALAPSDHGLALVLDNGGQLAAALLAFAACARVAVRGAPSRRRVWALLAVGVGSWAAGQAIWSYYEIALEREVPFPSSADVGFLLFPLVASAALLSWLRGDDRVAARVRDILDGLVIAGSLLVLSWATTLGTVYAAGGEDRLAFVLSLVYPVSDVIMATLVLLTLARVAGRQRVVLAVVAAGLGWLAVADSAYVYLVTIGSYTSGNLVGAGWVTGFLLIAVGAISSESSVDETAARQRRDGDLITGPAPRHAAVLPYLPYIPLLAAEITVATRLLNVPGVPLVDLGLGFALVALVLGRQFSAMSENRRLLAELGDARDQLHHQALHDPLTGLANRSLFTDRVEHALTLGRDNGSDVAVLFCDLDDFKTVNDDLGHGAGDALLCLVADRLRRVLRGRDTVARVGGDEFAVLLESSDDPVGVAQRLVAAIGQPYELDGVVARISLSVGIALASEDATANVDQGTGTRRTVSRLLQDADSAMYVAKAGGKGRAVLADPVGSARPPIGSAVPA